MPCCDLGIDTQRVGSWLDSWLSTRRSIYADMNDEGSVISTGKLAWLSQHLAVLKLCVFFWKGFVTVYFDFEVRTYQIIWFKFNILDVTPMIPVEIMSKHD